MSRQEKVLQAARKLEQKDHTHIKSEENPPGTRKLAACSPEFRNMEYANHWYMDKIFQNLEKKLGMSLRSALAELLLCSRSSSLLFLISVILTRSLCNFLLIEPIFYGLRQC